MDSLFHFILALMAGLIVGLHKKHGFRIILIFAMIAVLIDIDHFLFPNIIMKPFHNLFVVIMLPLILFLIFYKYEKKGEIKWQTYALLLFVVLFSHLIADLFYGSQHGVPLLYPFSAASYSFPDIYMSVPMADGTVGHMVTPTGISFMAGFVVFMLAHFMEDFIFYFKKKHMSVKKAWKKVFTQI